MSDTPTTADAPSEEPAAAELAPREPGKGITTRRRAEFDRGQMDLIRATVAKDCNDAELAMFLELCAAYELDPFAKQIWAIRIKGKVQIVVSRDGFLTLANRHTPASGFSGPGEFLGCESDVVREKDTFRKIRDHDGASVEHSYTATGRGKIVGAWAIVHRREHSPTYYFAEWATYNTGQNVWTTHPEAMIVKCAETMALRKAFSIAGVIGESEVPKQELTAVSADTGSAEIDWGDNEELAKDIQRAADVLGWRRAKVRMKLRACEDGQSRQALLRDMLNEVNLNGDEGIEDAQVVA